MHQYAWLNFHGGCWHLETANAKIPDRKWTSRRLALADLAEEGWIVEGAHEKQPTMKHESDRHCYGYGLRRTIH